MHDRVNPGLRLHSMHIRAALFSRHRGRAKARHGSGIKRQHQRSPETPKLRSRCMPCGARPLRLRGEYGRKARALGKVWYAVCTRKVGTKREDRRLLPTSQSPATTVRGS